MSICREAVVTPTRTDTPALRRMLAGTTALTTAAVCGWLLTADPAWALPTDGTVVEGQAEIIYGADSVTIQQGSDRVIIEWQTFDVGAHESVNFIQPHELAAALNRVLSGDASQILGSLSANGQVFISNPAGVVFGPDANVDVQSIVATSLDIMNDRFMAGGELVFDIAGDPTAVIENRGTINASGLAALVGPAARNSGAIVADVAILGGGEGFALDYYGDGLVNFAITDPTTQLPVDADGNPVEALVENTGTILSDGGQVILAADVAAGVIDTVINLDGVEAAGSIVNRGGQVVLLGGDEGTVQVAGMIDVSGDAPGDQGGTVHVLGDRLELDLGAEIDASGPAGGGQVLVGGARGGGPLAAGSHIAYAALEPSAGGTQIAINANTAFEAESFIPTADITYVGAEATIAADATDMGDGGTVIVWADQETTFQGAITAQGGVNGGDGGFVETSGADLTLGGQVNLATRLAGTSGTWLIDPVNITVDAAFIAGILPTLQQGSDVLITTAAPGSDPGNITFVDPLTVDFALDASPDDQATLTAIADNNIVQSAAIIGQNGVLNVTFDAANSVTINAALTTDGDTTVIARAGEIDVNAPITVGGTGNIDLFARRNIRADASIQNTGTGRTSLVAGWDGVTTDIATILATVSTYGNSNGAIFIGDGAQTTGIAVGSRFGASNFAGAAMTLLAGNTAENAFAQAGFRTDSSQANFSINGAITIALSDGAGTPGDLTATAGSQTGSYVQVGHGGEDLDFVVEPDGSYRGNITIVLANDLIFTGGIGVGASAQLGHGGLQSSGSHGGEILVTEARDLTFSGGGTLAYAQLGHGGLSAVGDRSGTITITRARDLTFTGGGTLAYAQLGHGVSGLNFNLSGAITITQARDVAFTSGDGSFSYAQFGHGGNSANGDFGGSITITQARDLTFTANAAGGYAQLGHGGNVATGIHSDAIDVTVLRNLTLTGQDTTSSYALIGHGGANGTSTTSGTVTVRAGGTAALTNAFIGHLITANGTYASGNTVVGVGSLLTADAASRFNSAPTGELRIYLPSAAADAVDAAALLNGVAHGANQAPNSQGQFAFGTGPYVPAANTNFAYYTLPAGPYNYFVEAAEAAAIVAALGGGAVALDTQQNFAQFGAVYDFDGGPSFIQVDAPIFYDSANALSFLATGDVAFNASVQNRGAAGGDINIVAGWDGTTVFNAATFLAADVTATTLFGNSNGVVTIGDGSQIAGIAVGSRSGATNAFGRDVILQAGNGAGADRFAQLGFQITDGTALDGTVLDANGANVAVTGAIAVHVTNNIVAAGGITSGSSADDAYAQIGHVGADRGGFNANVEAAVNAAIEIAAAGAITVSAGQQGSDNYAQIGHGGDSARGDHAGSITITRAGDLTFTASTAGSSNGYTQLGHGGTGARGSHTGNIAITATGNITFTAGVGGGSDQYAQLGHGGEAAIGSHSGDITIVSANNLSFSASTNNDPGGRSGSTDGYTQLGHGGSNASGSHSGVITIGRVGDITFTAGLGGGSRQYAQLGHGGFNAAGNHGGSITISQAGNVTFTATAGAGSFAGYAQLGHGGNNAVGNHGGAITISQAANVTFTAGNNSNAYAQIGHGGTGADGNHSGLIDVVVGNSLTLTGLDTTDQYALIGHGDDLGDGDAGNTVGGNVFVRVGGTAALTNAFIGHLMDGDGTATGNTFIGVGTALTTDAASQLNSAPTGQLRIYLASPAGDLVNAATLLNGTAHGATPAPNNQGQALFGAGPYAPAVGNFAYYTLDVDAYNYNYIVDTAAEAAAIAAALGAGNLTLDSLDTSNTGFATLQTFGAVLDLGSINPDGTPNLADTSYIEISQAINYNSANTLSLLATGDIAFNASVQNSGTGAVNVVAGWDGVTTDIAAILANPATYGLASSIVIGDGTQTAGIAVGSRFGASNFAGHSMTLMGSNTTQNGFAQAGFRADTTVAGFNINGAITIALSDGAGNAGDLIATAGSGTNSYVQVGHGGVDLDRTTADTDGSYGGTIDVVLARDLIFLGGSGGEAFAQLGHGGAFTNGNHTGSITLTQARNLTFTGGTWLQTYAQLGHGGAYADGNHSGAITIAEARDLTFIGGSTGGRRAYAQLGHGGAFADGNHVGAITITQARDLTFTGGTGNASYAQLGQGGSFADGIHSGAITIAQARNLTVAGGRGDINSYAQVGHGGFLADGSHSDAIAITLIGNLDVVGGNRTTFTSNYAQIGHGDARGRSTGTRQGTIDIRVAGETSLVNGPGDPTFQSWLIGHATQDVGGITNADVSLRTGTLDFSTVATSTLFGITADANGADFAAKMIANLAGGNVTLAATNGTGGATGGMLVGSAFTYASANTLTLFSTTDIRFAAGVQNGFGTAAGQGGAVNIVAGWDGATTDIPTILAGPTTYGVNGGAIFIGDGTQTAGIAVGSRFGASNFAGAAMTLRGSDRTQDGFAQAGFRDPGTGSFDIDGAIAIALSDGTGIAGDLTARGGSQKDSYVQVGHGGADLGVLLEQDGNYRGDITIVRANDLIFTGSSGAGSYSQLGHGGLQSNGDHSGEILITEARDLAFTGGDVLAYAQLGHGGFTGTGGRSGSITITRARDIAFTGRGTLSHAQLGHDVAGSAADLSGAITITQARDVAFTSGDGSLSYAQFGHGGTSANGNFGGSITITQARDLTFTANAGGSYAQLGHGGNVATGTHSGAIDVTVLRNLTLTGQDTTSSYALIGHGGASGTSTTSGTVTVRAGGTAALTNAFIGHLITANGTYASGNTVVGAGIRLTADAASQFNSAPTGELRLYVASAAADGVSAAALLNGVAHGEGQAPNNQGQFAFGAGPYDPANPIGGSAVVAGNFAYYTLDFGNAFNYIVDTPEAAAIVAALQTPGAVTLDTLQNLAQFGALPDLDGGTSFIRVDADIAYTSIEALTFQATGEVTFNANVQNGGAGNIVVNASGISVGTGRQLSTLGGIAFNAPTVNLDGNLTAALNAITGTANTVNVLSSAGGAQVQDAIDVASAGATINIGAGTYASYIINKANLTVSGGGDGTIINTGSPAVTVVANGATVRDQVLTFAGVGTPGADDIGILLDGTAAPGLTGIQIINVDFRNLQDGIRSQGDIGDGTAAVDVTIRGNSGIDRAVFEDFVDAAIDIGDTDGDAVYLIRDLTLRDGADADAFVSGRDAIRIGSDVGAVTIHGVVMTANAGDDGIDFDGTLNNATVIIGSTTAGDANTILGQSDGIETTSINGGSFTIQGNTRIFGVGDGMDFNGTISNSARVNIVDNVEISATLDAIDMTTITGSSVTIARNQTIRTSGVNSSDAIEFGLTISGNSVILIDGNTDIIGGDDGIDTDRDVVNSTFTISNNARIIGADDGIDFDGDIIGSNLTIARNQRIEGQRLEFGDGIEFSDPIVSNSVVLIDNNTTILGASDGIDFNDPVTDSRLTISNNQRIQGLGTSGDAIEFADPIGGTSVVLIDGNTALIGADDGIFLTGITGGRLTISNNALIQGGPPLAQGVDSNGIEFEAPVNGNAQVAIIGNTNITGALFGIDFQFAIGGTATVSIDRNGTATQGGAPYDGTQTVTLAGFTPVGAITNGIRFSDIGAASGVTVSRNIISGGNANGILFRGSINSTNPTALHNNFILGHGGDGIAFQGAIVSRTEVLQNFIARNGGNGILVRPTDGLSPNTLFVQVNFLPGAGFANGNGGFGYSQFGVGSPNLEGNWWGTPDAGFVAAINGVAAADLPTQIVTATGDDDANVSPPFANTAFEMFAFQPAAIGVPLTASAEDLLDVLGFTTDVETLRDDVRGPLSQLDRPGGAQFFTNELAEPFQTSVFTDGFSIGELQPAAGEETNGPVNLGELEPAAGPGSEQAQAEDLCVETYFGDFWNVESACQ